MADQDKPPIMLVWINSPRARRVEAWLWKHPKTAIGLTFVSFALISSPAWFSDVWSLFSNDVPVPTIMNWLRWLSTVSFSWYWLAVGLGVVMLAVITSLLWRERKRLETEVASARRGQLATADTSAENVHAECEKKISHLQARDEELAQVKTKYAAAIEMADYQRARIGDFVEVIRACTHESKLDADLPTIRWGFLIKNRSVFRIQLDGEVGALSFEGRRLSQPKEVQKDDTAGLWPDRDASLIFEQQLTLPEAEMLRRRPDGLFHFDQVTLHVKGYKDESVKSGRVIIGSEFRARLGRCSDIQSQKTEPLERQIEELKLKLNEASKVPDDKRTTERKAMIESWRVAVSKAVQEYRKGEWGNSTLSAALANQAAYLTLLPRLSESAKSDLHNFSDTGSIIEILADEIARIEQKWGL